METLWYYAQGGQQLGPVEFSELQQMRAAGKLGPDDLVWSDGMPQWAAAATIPNLLPAAPPGVPVPLPAAPLAYYAAPVGQEPVYAGFWLRFVAALVDGFLVFLIVLGISFVIGLLAAATGTAGPPNSSSSTALGFIIEIVSIAIVWLYFALQESGKRQATPGKNMLGLQVTDMQGQRIGFGRATGRFFGKYISEIILFVGFMMAGWTPRKQALHDMMAGCLVVKSGSLRVS